MSRSQNSFIKFQKEKKKRMKKKDKEERKLERRESSKGGDLSEMIAYVDEFGNITSTAPEPMVQKSVEGRA
ncbi:cold-shock protein [Reichenbachiella sp. 5M10]|uniref:cold-shock protein n=1 Tax=Reichenbachiella sp. 5M10 TaxID=1889772 RepID=UPI000C15C288|nr:cold-shock protein [Reichenbachiella sp. 5M10]PIB35505.1 cold-shock protein [Reichenbachiella sp. 5M10]